MRRPVPTLTEEVPEIGSGLRTHSAVDEIFAVPGPVADDFTGGCAEENGQVEICEDGVYCETVKTYVRPGEEAASRIEFRHDGLAYHLSVIEVSAGRRHQVPAEPEPMILPSGDDDESITSIEARPLCIHSHAGTGLAPAWH